MGEHLGSDSEPVLPKILHCACYASPRWPVPNQIEPDFFFSLKNEFRSQAPWLLLLLIKNSQSAICRVGKPGIMELGSFYMQNKTPKKGNKKAYKQCKLSHQAYPQFSPFKMYHEKSWINCNHNDAKFWLLWQIIPSGLRRGQESFVVRQKEPGVKAKATDICGGRLSCEQTLNKSHSPSSQNTLFWLLRLTCILCMPVHYPFRIPYFRGDREGSLLKWDRPAVTDESCLCVTDC